jgi:CRP-like cAMP-binding protein
MPRNRLLAALPSGELEHLLPRLEPVELVFRQVLIAPGEPIEAVFFPETGWTSTLIIFGSGDAGEVGLVGREGMIGAPLLFGDDRGHTRTIVQATGTALRVEAAAFRSLHGLPALRARLLRYALALHAQVSQIAACNGRHPMAQRLARWLLMAHDRAESDAFPMTHELLAVMLGVRRAGITLAAGALQRAGFIRYDRGIMEITDRPGLEAAACECYGAMEREFVRLMRVEEGP